MKQHFSPQPIFEIEKISYDNKDTITCYGNHDNISLSKASLQKDNHMFEALFCLLLDETKRHMNDELRCVLYMFDHYDKILSYIRPKYTTFISMNIKDLNYKNHEFKLSYSFCTRSFKAKISYKELVGLLSNDTIEMDIATIFIHEIDKKMLAYKDKYNDYTKSFVMNNESYLMLKYLNNVFIEQFDVPLKIESHKISFIYDDIRYEMDYQILAHLNPLYYSFKEIEIYNGFYNYDIFIENNEAMNKFIQSTISYLLHNPFFQISHSYTCNSQLTEIDINYNNVTEPLYNGMHKQTIDKPQYKLLDDIEAIYKMINYGICRNDDIMMNSEIEKMIIDSSNIAYKEAKYYLKNLFNELGIDENMIININGKGLLYGKTDFDYGDILLKQSYEIDGGCYKNNYANWCNHIKSALELFINDYLQQRQNIMNHYCKENPKLYGDKLKQDLCIFIIANEECITRKAIIQAMRGIKVQLNVNIKYTSGTGQYHLLDETYISDKIDDLINDGVLYEKYVKSYKYSFYMIKPYKSAYLVAKERYYSLNETNDKSLNDFECDLLFHKMIKQSSLDNKDYLRIYRLCEHLHFYCTCKEEIIKIFHECPESITKILLMHANVEKDKIKKKILKEIIKT
ncbi:MAG: hypothetical protein LUG12_00920 [Erysipelotrichaceae bacterium]|nr:hypothetical protein [Erysipelotrichaceae bacterium]